MEHNFKFGVSYAEQRPLTAPLPLCGDVCVIGKENRPFDQYPRNVSLRAIEYMKEQGIADQMLIGNKAYSFSGKNSEA